MGDADVSWLDLMGGAPDFQVPQDLSWLDPMAEAEFKRFGETTVGERM